MNDLVIKETIPSVDEYNNLRQAVSWHLLPEERAELGLKSSLYTVAIYNEKQLVAMGRIVGDGQVYFYLQDLMVLPEYQHHGLGSTIMERLSN
ncbi:MAG: GNAT family N-acetyltransferase, partial [Pseudomonadota bacterium]